MSPLMDALPEADVLARLTGALEKWAYKDNAIQRIHTCHEYLQSLELVNRIGHMAEADDHHPDLMLHYKRVTVLYWTHRAKGVTELDLDCAQKVEALIAQAFS